MKFVYKFLPLLIIFSCVGSDTAWLPDNIDEARNEGLLINVYSPSQKKIVFNGEAYDLEDSFTSFKYTNKYDKKINKSFFAFVIESKNSITGESIESSKGLIIDHVNFYSKNGGIHESQLGITYDDISMRDDLDTIKVGFLNKEKIEQTIYFVKKKK
jgi:hypothetical protein